MIEAIGGASNGKVSTDFRGKLCEAVSGVIYHCKKRRVVWLNFTTSVSASLNTVESHCLLYIPNNG